MPNFVIFSDLLWAAQLQSLQDPWLVDADIGMSLFSKASVIASSMNQANLKETCIELMKLFGNFEGLQRK